MSTYNTPIGIAKAKQLIAKIKMLIFYLKFYEKKNHEIQRIQRNNIMPASKRTTLVLLL